VNFLAHAACEQGVPPAAPAQNACSIGRTHDRPPLVAIRRTQRPPDGTTSTITANSPSYTDRHTFLRPLALRSKANQPKTLQGLTTAKFVSVGGHGVDFAERPFVRPKQQGVLIKGLYVSVRPAQPCDSRAVEKLGPASSCFSQGREHDRSESCTLVSLFCFRSVNDHGGPCSLFSRNYVPVDGTGSFAKVRQLSNRFLLAMINKARCSTTS
jgi:hypothetical protein